MMTSRSLSLLFSGLGNNGLQLAVGFDPVEMAQSGRNLADGKPWPSRLGS